MNSPYTPKIGLDEMGEGGENLAMTYEQRLNLQTVMRILWSAHEQPGADKARLVRIMIHCGESAAAVANASQAPRRIIRRGPSRWF